MVVLGENKQRLLNSRLVIIPLYSKFEIPENFKNKSRKAMSGSSPSLHWTEQSETMWSTFSVYSLQNLHLWSLPVFIILVFCLETLILSCQNKSFSLSLYLTTFQPGKCVLFWSTSLLLLFFFFVYFFGSGKPTACHRLGGWVNVRKSR